MKTFIVIGRGENFPLMVRFFKRRGVVEWLSAYALIFHEWKHFGFMILDNF